MKASDWQEDSTRCWLDRLEGLEVQLGPVSERLFVPARLRPGQHVLDVGCGAGSTTIPAAGRVGPSGQVTGVDISPGMIEAARHRPGGDRVQWRVDQAVSGTLQTGPVRALLENQPEDVRAALAGPWLRTTTGPEWRWAAASSP